jgi:toxin ParE1/3/4
LTRREVRWRRTARSDLLHLARRIAQDNPAAAHRLLDAAREAADMLAELPKLAPAGRFQSRGLGRIRIWPIRGFEKILMIYAAERTGIDVLRVVHGARDLDVLDLDAP